MFLLKTGIPLQNLSGGDIERSWNAWTLSFHLSAQDAGQKKRMPPFLVSDTINVNFLKELSATVESSFLYLSMSCRKVKSLIGASIPILHFSHAGT